MKRFWMVPKKSRAHKTSLQPSVDRNLLENTDLIRAAQEDAVGVGWEGKKTG